MNRVVQWEPEARSRFEAIVLRWPDDARRIGLAIGRFADTGGGDVKKLKGEWPATWRLRSGNWRVRFRLEGNEMIIVAVKNRRDAYE